MNDTYLLPQNVKVYDSSGNLVETLSSGITLRKIQAGPAVINYGSYCSFVTSNEYWVTNDYYLYGMNEIYGTCSDIFVLPPTSSAGNRNLYTFPTSNLINTLYFNVSTDYTPFTLNDKIGFELVTGSGGFNTTNFTASILSYNSDTKIGVLSNQLAADQIGNNPFATDDAGTKPFISGSYLNSLILNSSLSYFKDYLFLPSGSGFQENSLYKTYSTVENIFSPKIGDYVAIYYPNGYYESSISNIYFDGDNKLNLTLSEELPSALNKSTYVDGDITKFLILSKVNDETNVVLQFNKTVDQPTSLGFIIPNNLHPDVLANIDSITKEVKQKLVDFNTPDLGGF
jgi:hypothetical protein